MCVCVRVCCLSVSFTVNLKSVSIFYSFQLESFAFCTENDVESFAVPREF